MKVIYEFDNEIDNDDFYQHKIFKKANEMFIALVEISEYVREVSKGFINDDKDQMIDKIMEMVCESGIGEIE